MGFLGGTVEKESACQCRRRRRCGFDPGKGNGNPLQYPYLEKPMTRGHKESDMMQQISKHTLIICVVNSSSQS